MGINAAPIAGENQMTERQMHTLFYLGCAAMLAYVLWERLA